MTHENTRKYYPEHPVAVCLERVVQGQIINTHLLEADHIALVLDVDGKTPHPPNTAYMQIKDGQVLCNMTTDDLLYCDEQDIYDRLELMDPDLAVRVQETLFLQ